MRLEDSEMPEPERVQEVVTYDIVPELESYLNSIGKRLHSSMDENDEMMKQFDKPEKQEEEEDEKNSGSDDEEDRGRSRKRESRKKAKNGQSEAATEEQEAQQEDKSDIFERIDKVYRDKEIGEKALDEANELRSKYKIGI
mmetsp:Transcript_12841/g.17287  ORF Transcript_12841/g.17287 Transcript_12841/m.17287 type:complete len:141 (+) Transcript_12841:184-606(+)